MARIKRLWVVTVTSNESHAGTSAVLRLDIICSNGDRVSRDLRNPRGNDLARGQRQRLEVSLSQGDNIDDTQIDQLHLRIHGTDDVWLPKSILVISENVDGGIVLQSENPHWNRWFDPEFTPGYALHVFKDKYLTDVMASQLRATV